MFTVAILVRGNVGLPVPNFILLLYDIFYLLLLLIVFIAFLSIFNFAFDGLLIARSVCWSRNNVYFKCLEICLWLSYGNSLKMVCCQIILAYPSLAQPDWVTFIWTFICRAGCHLSDACGSNLNSCIHYFTTFCCFCYFWSCFI